MSTLTIAGTISFPLAGEASPPSTPFSTQLIYNERNIDDVVLVGAQADVDLMGLMTDAKACFIEGVSGTGAFKINGATPTLDISSSGGFWIWLNPNGGLTSLTVTTTTNASFRIYMFA